MAKVLGTDQGTMHSGMAVSDVLAIPNALWAAFPPKVVFVP
jgi:hypothetical protein